MKKRISLLLALCCYTSTFAQDNPMTVYPDNYGENYKSVAFDGTRSDNFSTPALFFGGKANQTFTIWGDTWGDVVVGAINNETGVIKSRVLINNQKLSINDYTTALSMSKDGKLTAYVAAKNVVNVFSAQRAESVAKFRRSNFKVSFDVKQLSAVSDNGYVTLFALSTSGDLYSITSKGNKWGEAKKVSSQKVEAFKSASNANGKVVLLLDGSLYNYAGGKLVADSTIESQIIDAMVDSEGVVSSIYKRNNKYYIARSNSKRAESLPLKGEIVEMVLDSEDTNTLYYTAVQDSITEINSLAKNGRKWVKSAITVDTPHNNRNVVPVVGASSDEAVQICWIQETTKDEKINSLAAIKVDMLQPEITDPMDKKQIKQLIGKVADWQLTYSFPTAPKNDWHWGAFYEGLMVAYDVTKDPRYLEEMMNVGEYFDWGLQKDVFHADRLLTCNMYVYLYDKKGRKDSNMLTSTKIAMDLHTSRKAKMDPHFDGNPYKFEWWSWCDALYMATPSFYTYSDITGDPAAREFALKQYKVTTDYLFSEEESLYYRDDRYFDAKSKNGKKVFWARGNGWVMGTLTRLLSQIPEDDSHYDYYKGIYTKMCAKFLELQRPNGLWTVSLLDPEELLLGESSGSAFYGYAFAWGVNNGVLDKAVYGEAAKRAWAAMSHNVSQFGRLGYVQQVAGSPFPFFEDQAHTYASGTYIMFANEMLKMK